VLFPLPGKPASSSNLGSLTPALLLPAPPPLLYYRGQVELLENRGMKPAVAIVGTRHPTDYGIAWTQRLGRALAERGFGG
jgi:DNA processing protein